MAEDDETEILLVRDRLAGRHPEVDPVALDSLVRECHADYATARVRDFVAVLVEREARRRLTGPLPV